MNESAHDRGVRPNLPLRLLATLAALALHPSAWADGFRLERARELEPHIVIQLSETQVAQVGRERKLILTRRQHENLAGLKINAPSVLGVESLGEPDCSCHISCAMWTATNEVTVWLNRVQSDGSKWYYETRRRKGHYTADANGNIFAAGKPVSWTAFETAVLRRKEKEFMHLSMPPTPPPGFWKRVQGIPFEKRVSGRL